MVDEVVDAPEKKKRRKPAGELPIPTDSGWSVRFKENSRPSPRLGDCWPWLGRTHHGGYGAFTIGKVGFKAHRLAWFLRHGPIAPGMHVLHHCDNPPCVNPGHLFLGTRADNSQDAARKGRINTQRYPMSVAGTRNGRHILDEDDVREARRMRTSGSSWREIAARFGVSLQTTRFAAIGATWRHVS